MIVHTSDEMTSRTNPKYHCTACGTALIMGFICLNFVLERNYAGFPCEENLQHFYNQAELNGLQYNISENQY